MPTLLATRYAGSGSSFIGPPNQPVDTVHERVEQDQRDAVATMFTAENRATSPVNLRSRRLTFSSTRHAP